MRRITTAATAAIIALLRRGRPPRKFTFRRMFRKLLQSFSLRQPGQFSGTLCRLRYGKHQNPHAQDEEPGKGEERGEIGFEEPQAPRGGLLPSPPSSFVEQDYCSSREIRRYPETMLPEATIMAPSAPFPPMRRASGSAPTGGRGLSSRRSLPGDSPRTPHRGLE